MNNEKTRFNGEEPIDAIKLENVDIEENNYKRNVGFFEERLPDFVQVRYLYQDGELEGGEKRRGTDPVWSLKMYDLKKSMILKNDPIFYFLNGPKKGYVREQLQVVPENSENTPKFVL